MTPIYRLDIKGQVASIKRDCTDSMRNEREVSENFILAAVDTAAWNEYKCYLTERELLQCWKESMR